MKDTLEVLCPEMPEGQDEIMDLYCSNCGALCGVCIGLAGDLKLCGECGFAELAT